MSTHFSNIGFGPTNKDLASAVSTGVQKGQAFETPRGALIFWTPGEGIEIWSQINELDGRNVLMDCNPHYSGSARMRVGLLDVITYGARPSDGSIYVNIALCKNDPSEGDGSLLLDVPDFDLVRDNLTMPSIVDVQIAAFANVFTHYASEEEFMSIQTPMAEFEGEPIYLGAELIIPNKVDGNISSSVRMTAHIRSVEEVVNPHTGYKFYHLLVTTLGGEMDVVADPAIVGSRPQINGVIRGDFWLSGRLVK